MNQKDRNKKGKSAIGGLIGKSNGGHIKNSHFKGKITINGDPEFVDVGGLVGNAENTEITGSSADAKIEFVNKASPTEPIFELKPNWFGFGINLRALFSKIKHKLL